MDALSEILRGVVLKGALYFNAEFSAPWGFRTPLTAELAQLLTPGAPHLMIYHFLVEGSGIVRVEGDQEIPLSAGDVIVVTHGGPHDLCSAVDVAPKLSDEMKAKLRAHDFTTMQSGGGGDVARFVCGFMVCDPLLSSPILRSLPPAFKVNLRTDRAGQWLETSLKKWATNLKPHSTEHSSANLVRRPPVIEGTNEQPKYRSDIFGIRRRYSRMKVKK